MKAVTITKLEAAKRQLDIAIELYFTDRDLGSVHTLAAASGTVLGDLVDKATGDSWRNAMLEDSGLQPKEFFEMMRATQNFLKHADRDHDATHELSEEDTEAVLMIAVCEAMDLGPMSIAASVFQLWYLALHKCEWDNHELRALALRFFPDLAGLPKAAQKARGWQLIQSMQISVPKHGGPDVAATHGRALMDEELQESGNDVIDRIRAIDELVSQALAFKLLLQDLNGRSIALTGEQAEAVAMVRAGILRSLIGTVAAAFDPADGRNNRASLGQVASALGNSRLCAYLSAPRGGQAMVPHAADLMAFATRYDTAKQSDIHERVRRLRNGAVAHNLIRPMQTVEYEDVYALELEAEALVKLLLSGIGLREAVFEQLRPKLTARAKLFWDTYFGGMGRD